MKKKLISIVLALGIMVALFPVSAFAAGSEETKAERKATYYGRNIGSSDDNYVFVTDGEFFYYIVDIDEDSAHKKLMKRSVAGGQETVLYQPSEGASGLENLNISGEWLYFTSVQTINWPQKKANIYKMKTDGTGLTSLYEMEYGGAMGIHDMLIVDDKIYFVAQFPSKEPSFLPWLICMDINGSNLDQLFQGGFFRIAAYERQLILMLSNEKSILLYDIDTKNTETIKVQNLYGGTANYLQVSSDGHIFVYLTEAVNAPAALYSFTLDGKNTVEVNSASDRYIIVGNEILYYNHTDSSIYKRSFADGSVPQKITDRAVHKWFNYHNGYLFTRSPETNREVYIYPVSTASQPDGQINKITEYTDVPSNAYYADSVRWAVENKITSGTSKTTFSPGATCNRAQILSFLWRASGSPEPKTANPFNDIKSTDYFYKAALWAAEKGMVSGPAFGASTPCTRASTMEYMWKAAGSPAASYDGQFSDVSTGAGYAQAVAWAVKNNVTAGTSKTTFGPDNTCTRGQIVTFLYRAYGE